MKKLGENRSLVFHPLRLTPSAFLLNLCDVAEGKNGQRRQTDVSNVSVIYAKGKHAFMCKMLVE